MFQKNIIYVSVFIFFSQLNGSSVPYSHNPYNHEAIRPLEKYRRLRNGSPDTQTNPTKQLFHKSNNRKKQNDTYGAKILIKTTTPNTLTEYRKRRNQDNPKNQIDALTADKEINPILRLPNLTIQPLNPQSQVTLSELSQNLIMHNPSTLNQKRSFGEITQQYNKLYTAISSKKPTYRK